MSNRSLKGKLFDDGIWRYYDQKQHKWLTQEEIDEQRKAEGFSNVLIAIGGGIIAVGGLLYMVIVTFS